MKRSQTALYLMMVTAILLTGCGSDAETASRFGQRPPALVQTERAEARMLTTRAEAVGTLVGNESVTLTAKVTDQVSAVYFEGGEVVEKGQVLVDLIDVEQFALLQQAEANLRELELKLERLMTLGEDVATAAEIDLAAARVDANQALLKALRSRIEDRSITAPFDGVIGLRQLSVGALVTPGTVIAELDDVNPLKLDFTLPEHYLSRIDVGDVIGGVSTAWGDEVFAGTVSQIGSRIDPVTRAFPVRAMVSNDDARLRPGMLLAVTLELDASPAVVVPETALLQTGAQSAIYRVEDNDTVRRIPVEIGRRVPGAIEIRSGIKAGDRVVIKGHMGLRGGASVREVESST